MTKEVNNPSRVKKKKRKVKDIDPKPKLKKL